MRDRPMILGALALLLVVLAIPFWHGVLAHTGGDSPVIPPAKGAHCVRPAQWMIKNHMKLLMQVRYEAVHEGIRHEDESLPGCMNCHVSRLPDGRYPSVTSKKFFCTACHEYAGVHIGCFSCHTNRPQAGGEPVAQAGGGSFLSARARRAAEAVPGRGGGVSSAAAAVRRTHWMSQSWRSP